MGQEGAVFTDTKGMFKYIFSAAARVGGSGQRSFMAELPRRSDTGRHDSYLYQVAASREDGRAIALQYGPYERGMTLDDPCHPGEPHVLANQLDSIIEIGLRVLISY